MWLIYRGTTSKTKTIKEEAAKASLDVAHAVCVGLRAQFRAFFYVLFSCSSRWRMHRFTRAMLPYQLKTKSVSEMLAFPISFAWELRMRENMIDNLANSFYYQRVSTALESLAVGKQEGNG